MRKLLKILFGNEVEIMMAMLWAQKIMLGKKTFAQVPRLLREQVREILVESGYESLTEDGV